MNRMASEQEVPISGVQKDRLMGYSFRQPSPTINSSRLAKYSLIFMALITSVLCFVLWWMDTFEFHRTANPAFIPQVPTVHQSFCAFRPLSSKEAFEEEKILKSIAWPTTPSITSNYTFENSSNPLCSKFTILPKVGGEGQWYIGDQLEVSIIMKDYYCHPKTSGGDVLLVSLKNRDLQAGVRGQVVDHLNGSYTALFPLVWEGQADVEVTLVHPSEAVTVLQRLTSEEPDRIYFQSVFRSGSVKETTMCNICLRPSKRPVCDFTDLHTGEPWFCLKPQNTKLKCSDRINHIMGGFVQKLRKQEEKLFIGTLNMKVPILAAGSSSVTVNQKKKGFLHNAITSWLSSWSFVHLNFLLPKAFNSQPLEMLPSGFYYKGGWKSLGITEVQQFDNANMVQCLKGKVVHLYGDSTMRQWFEYFSDALPDLKMIDLHTSKQSGPLKAEDRKNNILVTYQSHAPPIRFGEIQMQHLRYIANELDGISGGASTVVCISVWSHFSTFPVEVYIQRLMSIRSAVGRLLARAPDTIVVIRTGNPKALMSLYETITNSDWFSLQRDKALRALFKGMNVHLVDAWDMVLAHQLPHSLHPEPPIIKNMINVVLSHTCPKMQSENSL